MGEGTKTPLYVAAINLGQRRAVLSDGTEVPITNLVSEDDDEADPEDAVALVCGRQDAWFTCLLSEFDFSGRRV